MVDTNISDYVFDWNKCITPKFVEFPKIPRLSREIVITEKIDGTSGCIHITEDNRIYFGSRTRWITPEDDNYGFARWGTENKEELLKLGVGSHFGEWWGNGIQRKYNLKEKRFSLFNTSRWNDETKPTCCSVVPILYTGLFDTNIVEATLKYLSNSGSYAAPGFMNPEGIVIWHEKARVLFKKTIGDDGHKTMKVKV
jgi:hypothetical protein